MASNQLSSTNIAEILESQIEAMKNINEVIVGAQIDEAMLKNIVDTVKPIQDVIVGLSKIADEMSKFKISDVIGSVKFKLSVKGLVSNIKYIVEELGKLEVDKEAEKKTKVICDSISSLSGISTDLMQIGMASIVLVAMKPMILKTIKLIVEINEQLSNMQGETDIKTVVAIGDMLSALGKSLLVFVFATMGGAIPLLAIVSLLAVKAFIWVFVKLFSKEMFQDLQVSIDGIIEIGKAITLLSLTIVLMALTGLLIVQSWKEILVTMLFVAMTIGLFALLSLASKVVDEGKKSLVEISLVLVILSTTVLLWALTGELIEGESENIWMTVMFVGIAIGLFALLGLAGNIIKTGGKTILLVALSLVMLSLTVLLWAETGDFVAKNWENVVIMSVFVGIAIGLFALLGWAGNVIKEGGLTMIFVAGSLFILSATVILWAFTGGYVQEHWVEVLIVSSFVLVAIGLFFLLGLATSTISGGSASLLLLSAGLAVLSLTALLFIYVGEKIRESWEDLLIVGAFVGVVTLIMVGFSALAPIIAPGIAAIAGMSITLLLLSTSLIVLGKASKLYDKDTIDLIGTLLVTLGKQVAFLGVLSIPIMIGSAAMITMGASVSVFSNALFSLLTGIQLIKALNLDPEKDKALLQMPVDIVWTAIERASHIKTVTLLKGVAKIVALGSASLSISNMADTVQKFASLTIPTKFDKDGKPIEFRQMTDAEFNMASQNIQTIISCILKAIGEDEVTGMLEGLSKKAIKNICLIMDNTSGVVNLVDAIKAAVTLDENQVGKGVANLKSIISQYSVALQELFVGTGNIVEQKGWFGKKSYKLEITGAPELDPNKLKDISKSLKQIVEINEPVKAIVDSVSEMSSNIEGTDPSNIGKYISEYALSVTGDENGNGGIKTGTNVNQQLAVLKYIIDQNERIAKIKSSDLSNNTDTFIKFVDKANSIDTDKIKSVRDMFEQMARFSESVQGDFEKLADVLSDKLVEVLDKLNNTIENVEKLPRQSRETTTTGAGATNEAAAKPMNNQQEKQTANKSLEKLIGYVDGIEDALEKLNQSINSYHKTGIRTTV